MKVLVDVITPIINNLVTIKRIAYILKHIMYGDITVQTLPVHRCYSCHIHVKFIFNTENMNSQGFSQTSAQKIFTMIGERIIVFIEMIDKYNIYCFQKKIYKAL